MVLEISASLLLLKLCNRVSVEPIDKANQGDLAPVELKDRQAKTMQDLDIRNIL